ncbi:hypothetical protein [Nocardia carnea]|uniref:hypothetical protein n=1 Tax=Nocardia carnea TaxID=37328 RepID=UPI002455E819|nr:hypothetical protein [Nocardia carnea]
MSRWGRRHAVRPECAGFLCGSVLFTDGGTDAHFRPNDRPRAVPLRGVVGYLRKFLRLAAARRAG